jgi:hypothetical protein
MALVEVVTVQSMTGREVDQRQVGIVAGTDRTFARQAKPPGWFTCDQRSDAFQWKTFLIQQNSEGRLYTRDATPGRPKISGLHLR